MATPPAPVDPAATENLTLAVAKKLKTAEILKLIFPEDSPIYIPHGKWGWITGEEFIGDEPGTRLGSGLEGQVDLKVSYVNDRRIVYISKLTSVWDCWKSFFTSLYLNTSSKYLRPLQGDCVPWVIGVNHCMGGRIGVALDLPHSTGWREADMFLKESQKEAIIAAYQKLHDRGILHGDAEYRHMLIGDDEKVTIIDFGLSKVVNPDEWDRKAGLEACSPSCIRTEMRKVKFMLDWKDSRATEFRLGNLRVAREARDRTVADAALAKDKTDPFDMVKVSKEPLSEEEQQHPDGGLRLSDLNAWSYGDSWTATHYEVYCYVDNVAIKKSKVPSPPIQSQVTSMESTNTLAKDETLLPPAMEIPSNAPAVVIDSTATTSTNNDAPSEKPEELNPSEEPATSVISKYLTIGHLKSAIGRFFTWQQKGQKEQRHEPEKTHETAEKDTEMKQNETNGDADPEEKRGEKEEKEDAEGKKSETSEQKHKNVDSEPAKNIDLGHDRADCAKVDPKQRTTEPAKGPVVLEKLTETLPLGMEFTRTIAPRQGNADPPRTAIKRRLEADLEEIDQRTEQTVTSHLFETAQVIDCDRDNSDEPAKKRQRTVPTLQELEGRIAPNPSSDEMDAEDSDGISSSGLTSSGTSTSSDKSDIMHPLFDDEDADPTLYELDPDECALLRREAARAFARFTTATTRVRPHVKKFTKENHNLEKCRSELLRIIVMLPRKDRTTLWTNMGQPDVRALLGLRPDVPDSNEPNESNKSSPPQQAPEVAPQGYGSTIRPCLGPLMRCVTPGGSDLKRMARTFSEQSSQELTTVQKEDAKSSTKGILQRRLEIKRRKERLAMPPPPPPTLGTKRMCSPTMNTFKITSIASRVSPPIHSSRDIFQQGSSSQGLPSAPQGVVRRGSASAEQSTAHQHYHHYYENMRQMMDAARKSKPDAVLSSSVPSHIRAFEGRRGSDTPAESSTSSRPMRRSLVRTTSSWNLGSMNASIPTGTNEGGLTGTEEEASRGTDGKTKRKREVTDDGERTDAKRRKM